MTDNKIRWGDSGFLDGIPDRFKSRLANSYEEMAKCLIAYKENYQYKTEIETMSFNIMRRSYTQTNFRYHVYHLPLLKFILDELIDMDFNNAIDMEAEITYDISEKYIKKLENGK